MTLLASPMIALYMVSVWLAGLFEKQPDEPVGEG
jgi:Sec-independent protein secretion pathway component TatC